MLVTLQHFWSHKLNRNMARQIELFWGGESYFVRYVPHKSQKLIYNIKLLQLVKVIVSNCRFKLSQLCLFDLAVIFIISDKIFNISCKNKCYILIHLQNYFKNSDFTVKLTPSIDEKIKLLSGVRV